VFGATEEQRIAAIEARTHDELPMIALRDLTAPHSKVELLHIDIQGGEANLLADSIDVLAEKVAYVVVGTDSRLIEGRIMDTMGGAGWVLEVERPALYILNGGAPILSVDGVQGWRNSRLSAGH
jgi:hypothetical protein